MWPAQSIPVAAARAAHAASMSAAPPVGGAAATGTSHAAPPPPPEPVWYDVTNAEFAPHAKKDAGPGHPKTLRVDYFSGCRKVASEWVCVEHDPSSFAGGKALRWFSDRLRPEHGRLADGPDGTPAIDHPDGILVLSAGTAARIGEEGGLRIPARIALVPDGRFQRIVDYDFTDHDEAPSRATAPAETSIDDEPPF